MHSLMVTLHRGHCGVVLAEGAAFWAKETLRVNCFIGLTRGIMFAVDWLPYCDTYFILVFFVIVSLYVNYWC